MICIIQYQFTTVIHDIVEKGGNQKKGFRIFSLHKKIDKMEQVNIGTQDIFFNDDNKKY